MKVPDLPRPASSRSLRGVVAVVGGDVPISAGREALHDLIRTGLGGIEVRADLLADPPEALRWLREKPAELPALYTLRTEAEGGRFRGSEADRLRLYDEALASGATWVDAEWGTEAAHELARRGAPLIVSHHDFQATPHPGELAELGERMSTIAPLGVKLVPTARSLGDVATILEWVAGARPGEPFRIGFGMGEAGFPSRALAIARGSPITYASLGAPVAPGQISARELLEVYRPQDRSRATRILGVAGNPVGHSLSPHIHNPALRARGIDAIYVPILAASWGEVLEAIDRLPIDGLSVTIPFKEDALRSADHADARSRAAGAANTIRVERDPSGRRTALRAFNTDLDGVLGPLRRRVGDLRGWKAAVLGNGGAARGAVRALIEAGASPTLYYRNEARGGPVARELGIPGRPLGSLRREDVRIIINATSLGLKPGDPSPVAPSVFSRGSMAFEMVYEPARTRFLADAEEAGAVCIPGGEMLVSQAVEQFRIFTGLPSSESAGYEELEENLRRGRALRKGPAR